jgi:hypothetical protein
MVTQIGKFSLQAEQQQSYYQDIAETFFDLGALAPVLLSK